MKKRFEILSFWTVWVISSTIGVVVGIMMVGYLQFAITEAMNDGFFSFLTGATFGLGVATSQWLSLRGEMRRAIIWIPFTALGFAAGCVTYWGLNIVLDDRLWSGTNELSEDTLTLFTTLVVLGIPSGALQSISLIDGAKRLAFLWIPIHTVGVIIAFTGAFAYIDHIDTGLPIDGLQGIVPILLVGSLYGLVTGLPLAMALKFDTSNPKSIAVMSDNPAPPETNPE